MNKLFSSNIAVRIISVLIALVIWVVASDQSISQNTNQEMSKNFYRIPIEVLNIPNNYSIKYDVSIIESVVLNGNSSLLSGMLGQEITASINLEGLVEGEYDVPVQLRYPAGLNLVAVQPHKVHVTLVGSVSRVMDVQIVTQGLPDITGVLPVISYKPETVLLEGPRTSLEKVARSVVIVNLTGKLSNFEQAMDVQVLDANGLVVNDVTVQPSMISVTVLFRPMKTVTLKLDDDFVLPEGWVLTKVDINHPEVEIMGEQSELNKVATLEIMPEPFTLTEEEKTKLELSKKLKANIILPAGSLISVRDEKAIEVTLYLRKS